MHGPIIILFGTYYYYFYKSIIYFLIEIGRLVGTHYTYIIIHYHLYMLNDIIDNMK